MNRIATVRALSPKGNYSHMVMVMRSLMERLMKRCSPEWRRRPAAATARWRRDGGSPPARERQPAAARSGGGPWGQRPLAPLLPWRWCWYGGGPLALGGCLGGGKFVVLCDLGFLSLYRFPNSRHQIFGFQ